MSNLIIIFGFLIIFLVIISVIIFKKEKKVVKEYKNIENFSIGNIENDIQDIFKTSTEVFDKAIQISKEASKVGKYINDIPNLMLKLLLDGLKKMGEAVQDLIIKILPEFIQVIGGIIIKIIIEVWEFLKKEIPELKYLILIAYIFGIIQLLPFFNMLNSFLSLFISKSISSGLIIGLLTLTYFNISTVMVYLTKTIISLVMSVDYKKLIINVSKLLSSEFVVIFGQIKDLINV